MTCNGVAQVADGQVSIALFVRYDHLIAAAWWSVLSIVHRQAMPVILQQGRRVLTSRSEERSHQPVGAWR